MALTGDFKKLGQLSENLRRLSTVPAHIARDVAPALKALTEEQFDRGVNPYGRAWARLAPSTLAKGRTPPPLTDTRAMRNSLAFLPVSGEGIRAQIAFPAGTHQVGSANMPARQIFPAGTFPKTWRTVLDAAARKAVSEIMKGVA